VSYRASDVIVNFRFLVSLNDLIQTVTTKSIHEHVLLLGLLVVSNLIVNSFN